MYAYLASSNSPIAMTLGLNSFFHFLILHTACCNNVKPVHFGSTQFDRKYWASKCWISHRSAVVMPVRLCKRVVPIWTWWPIHSGIHLFFLEITIIIIIIYVLVVFFWHPSLLNANTLGSNRLHSSTWRERRNKPEACSRNSVTTLNFFISS